MAAQPLHKWEEGGWGCYCHAQVPQPTASVCWYITFHVFVLWNVHALFSLYLLSMQVLILLWCVQVFPTVENVKNSLEGYMGELLDPGSVLGSEVQDEIWARGPVNYAF